MGVRRDLLFDGLEFAIIGGGVHFPFPIVNFGFAFTKLQLLSVGLHLFLFDGVLAFLQRVFCRVNMGLSSFDLLGATLNLRLYFGNLNQELMQISDYGVANVHSISTDR